MKFVCFAWVDPAKFAGMSQETRAAHIEQCFEYDDRLRRDGHVLGGQALQPGSEGKTVRPGNGRRKVTDGPYAETKEFIGGILIVEARDIDQAIELMSKHPGSEMVAWEIRPAIDMWPVSRPELEALNL